MTRSLTRRTHARLRRRLRWLLAEVLGLTALALAWVPVAADVPGLLLGASFAGAFGFAAAAGLAVPQRPLRDWLPPQRT